MNIQINPQAFSEAPYKVLIVDDDPIQRTLQKIFTAHLSFYR